MTKRELKRYRRYRIELEKWEQIAKRNGMDIEEYVKEIVIPVFLVNGACIAGLLYRRKLRELDKQLGEDWWNGRRWKEKKGV